MVDPSGGFTVPTLFNVAVSFSQQIARIVSKIFILRDFKFDQGA